MAKLVVPSLMLLVALNPSSVLAQKGGGSRSVLSPRGFAEDWPTSQSPQGQPDTILSIDLSGHESWDYFGSPNNEILVEILGAGAQVTGVGWDLTIQTVVPTSWLHEAVAAFYSNHADGFGFDVAPGVGDYFSGTASYSSGGIIDLSDFDIGNLPIAEDGVLYIQLWESFDDVENAVDARYPSGRYDVAYISGQPVDSMPVVALALLGLLLLAAGLWPLTRKIYG